MQKLNTLFIGKVLLTFPELPSTNTYATELLAKSRPIEGTVISTEDQTAGRGQIGSKWVSHARKNLTCSSILFPSFLHISQHFYLNIAVSLAVMETVQHFMPNGKVQVKWPNDVYLNDKKVAGILLQNSLQGQNIQNTIIGVGLNILQTDFPKDIPNATSFLLEAPDEEFQKEAVLFRFCEYLEKWYLQLKAGNLAQLKKHYFQLLLGLEEDRLFMDESGQQFRGRIKGVSEEGRLMIETNDEIRSFGMKEVKFL